MNVLVLRGERTGGELFFLFLHSGMIKQTIALVEFYLLIHTTVTHQADKQHPRFIVRRF